MPSMESSYPLMPNLIPQNNPQHLLFCASLHFAPEITVFTAYLAQHGACYEYLYAEK